MTTRHDMEVTTVRLPKGSDARIMSVLKPTENRSDFVRRAVAAALKAREEARHEH